MNHLPFIVAAYAVFLVVSLAAVIDAAVRLRRTTRRLAALDRRNTLT